jgi:hypothetical protein
MLCAIPVEMSEEMINKHQAYCYYIKDDNKSDHIPNIIMNMQYLHLLTLNYKHV